MTPLHGQPRATEIIRAYLENPKSCAFLLHGPTGTGKTLTAHNLAEGLGVANDIEYGAQFRAFGNALVLATGSLLPGSIIVINELWENLSMHEKIFLANHFFMFVYMHNRNF